MGARVQAIAWQQLPADYSASWNVSVSNSSPRSLVSSPVKSVQHTCTVFVAGGDTK